jgi:hypothetical protein
MFFAQCLIFKAYILLHDECSSAGTSKLFIREWEVNSQDIPSPRVIFIVLRSSGVSPIATVSQLWPTGRPRHRVSCSALLHYQIDSLASLHWKSFESYKQRRISSQER